MPAATLSSEMWRAASSAATRIDSFVSFAAMARSTGTASGFRMTEHIDHRSPRLAGVSIRGDGLRARIRVGISQARCEPEQQRIVEFRVAMVEDRAPKFRADRCRLRGRGRTPVAWLAYVENIVPKAPACPPGRAILQALVEALQQFRFTIERASALTGGRMRDHLARLRPRRSVGSTAAKRFRARFPPWRVRPFRGSRVLRPIRR